MKTLFAAIFTFILCSTAHADWDEWEYDKIESAFAGTVHVAFVPKYIEESGYGLSLYCSEDWIFIIFGTKVAYEVGQHEKTHAELLVRVDDGDIQSFDGKIEPSKDYMKTGVRAYITSHSLLTGIRDAKQRVAVAYRDHEGTLWHEHSFTVQGATRAMNQFIENCPTARRLVEGG